VKDQKIRCPYCDSLFEVDADWIVKNERVFCNTCCKSFEVKLTEKEEKPTNYYGEYYD
jgi:transcription elongation factor Elf1